METTAKFRNFVYLSLLIITGCTTGKNALQKGDYDASVAKAVSRLQNSPKNTEALQVLQTAYDFAKKDHLQKIEEARLSANLFKWESILYDYQKLNELADNINSCPACLAIVPTLQSTLKRFQRASIMRLWRVIIRAWDF